MTANTSIAHRPPGKKMYGRGQRLIGALAVVGGGLVAIGTLLPWFSLFAGLQSYSGLVGLNGRLLVVSGVLASIAGTVFFLRASGLLRWGIGLWGFVLLAWTGWLILQLLQTYTNIAADPLMVAALGPGLFVVLAGAALIFSTMFVKHE